MAHKRITLLGGGSLYFTHRLTGLLKSEQLAGSEIVLYDIDPDKLDIVTDLYRTLAEKAGQGFRIRSTTRLSEAVDGTDFAISAIGGSGAEVTPRVYHSYYHAADITIPEKYGIYQVVGDTAGPAGMMMGLRSVPVYLDICQEMEKRCPQAILLNHSNPMAVLCRAIRKYTGITSLGICHGVQAGLRHVAEILNGDVTDLECTWIGTNHYYWFTSIRYRGEDVYPVVMQALNEHPAPAGSVLGHRLSSIYGYMLVYPKDNHVIEFYPYGAQAAALDDLPGNLAEEARKRHAATAESLTARRPAGQGTREEFLGSYKELVAQAELPAEDDNPLTGEGVVSLLEAITAGRREVFILNMPNRGIVSNLPADAIIEAEAVSDSRGARGIHVGACPVHLKGILEKRFAWHELVVDAAVNGDRNLALQALLLDEMSIPPKSAEAMLNDLLESSRPLLPRFFPSSV